jgi:hypothetical protein
MSIQNRLLPRVSIAAALATTTLLAACGGGGGGSTAQPVAGTTFPVQAAIAKLYATGFENNVIISGTLTGSSGTSPVSGAAVYTRYKALAATFNGQSAYATTRTINTTITTENGQAIQPISLTFQRTTFLSASYAPAGAEVGNGICVPQTPSTYPTTVTLGPNGAAVSGAVVTYACVSTTSPSVPLGTESISFKLAPGNSSNTATLTIFDNRFDTSGTADGSRQTTYSIDTTGNMSFLSESGNDWNTTTGVLGNLTFTAQ